MHSCYCSHPTSGDNCNRCLHEKEHFFFYSLCPLICIQYWAEAKSFNKAHGEGEALPAVIYSFIWVKEGTEKKKIRNNLGLTIIPVYLCRGSCTAGLTCRQSLQRRCCSSCCTSEMTINVCWSCISNSEWRLLYIYISPFPHPEGNQNYFLRIWENVKARVCRATFFSLICVLHFEVEHIFFFPLYHIIQKPEWAIVFLNFSRQSKNWFLNLYARNSRNILNLTKNFLELKNDSNTSVENNKFSLRFHYNDFTFNSCFFFIFSYLHVCTNV